MYGWLSTCVGHRHPMFPNTDTLLCVICSSSMPDVAHHTVFGNMVASISVLSSRFCRVRSDLDLPRFALLASGATLFVKSPDDWGYVVGAGYGCCLGRGAGVCRTSIIDG